MKLSERPILIVEDSDDDFEATVRALTRGTVIENPIVRSHTGQDALDYLAGCALGNKLPAFVLLDLNMPGVDGRDVLNKIKNHVSLRRIPVVVFTTSCHESDIRTCYAMGANSFVQKPPDYIRLKKVMADVHEYWTITALLPN